MIKMKKLVSSMAIIALIGGTITSSFGQVPEKKSEEAIKYPTEQKKEVKATQPELIVVQKDSVSEYQKLTNESSVKFTENEKSIVDLRAGITSSNSYAKDADLKRVGILEQKNNDLKKELAGCKVEGKTEFATFKSAFNSNLDQLTKELKDFKITV